MQITTGGGAPGEGSAICIRGRSSLSARNDPLFVIDGLPVDIENFTVLKILIPEGGYCRLKAGKNALTCSFRKTDWGLIGDVKPGGWDADKNMTHSGYPEFNGWENYTSTQKFIKK